jgi:hypothetical protein
MLFALLWVAFFTIPRYLIKRAVSQVISIFRQSHSLCSESPKTVNELGLEPKSLADRMLKLRDYKPYALQILVYTGVVRVTNDEKVCLLEEKVPELLQMNKLA